MKSLGVSLVSMVVVIAAPGVDKTQAEPGQGITAVAWQQTPLDVFRAGDSYLRVDFAGWGPNWKPYIGFRHKVTARDGAANIESIRQLGDGGATFRIDTTATQVDKRTLQMQVALHVDKDTDILILMCSLDMAKAFPGGEATFVSVEGEPTTQALPLGKGSPGLCKVVRLTDAAGNVTRCAFEPAAQISLDGQVRIALASRHVAKDTPVRTRITLQLPSDITFYAGAAEAPQEGNMEKWYPFQATCDMSKPSEFDMAGWLDAPAGKHGRVLPEGGKLMYDGKPIKLWGLNLCYGGGCPEHELADQRAAFYSRYGVNAVRLHKYADGPSGILTRQSFLEFDPEKLERMDYQVAKFKEHGIYTKLSSTFHVKLGPKDLPRVPYSTEFGSISGGRLSTATGSIYLSKELQDLQIEQIVKILKHANPHTKLTYAEDPCIAVVELFNEDSVLFGGTQSTMARVPTLRERIGRRFHEWLKKRYGTKEALLTAWGEKAWRSFEYEKLADDNWEEGIVMPAGGHPWYLDPTQLEGSQNFRKKRLLDTMLFLYEIQNEFYGRYVEAIRKTGYQGAILASNWQAGRAFSHYSNLHSDYLVGLIDRHNYFGGGKGGLIRNESMLRVPGSGTFSAGMQQVVDRPFMLSEWIHCEPNEWGVEGPAIVGAYGMGLQGWDVSYIFQNRDRGRFLETVWPSSRDVWRVMTPQVFGVFPAVARHVLRGDVKEAEILAPRYVHVPSLPEGKLSFTDTVTQQHDVKTFTSDKVPAETLAVARCVVEFTDQYRATPAFKLTPYRRDGTLVSTTEQLVWHAGASKLDGFFTMDTSATQAVVGFAEGQRCELSDVTIQPRSRYGALYVTAQGRDEILASARKVLIVAIARARNTGAKIHADRVLLDHGKAPILMEPVRASLTLKRPAKLLHLLDHDGGMTDKTLPVQDGTVEIDTGRDKTCYYLLQY